MIHHKHRSTPGHGKQHHNNIHCFHNKHLYARPTRLHAPMHGERALVADPRWRVLCILLLQSTHETHTTVDTRHRWTNGGVSVLPGGCHCPDTCTTNKHQRHTNRIDKMAHHGIWRVIGTTAHRERGQKGGYPGMHMRIHTPTRHEQMPHITPRKMHTSHGAECIQHQPHTPPHPTTRTPPQESTLHCDRYSTPWRSYPTHHRQHLQTDHAHRQHRTRPK